MSASPKNAAGSEFQADVDSVQRIESVPTILEVVCSSTGMRFAAVARVTPERWVACSVLDRLQFGLVPGGELKIETTICNEIQQSREAVVIDHVAKDAKWCGHPTPAMYGFQSYISMPIILNDGSFFGTLCAIDPRPALLRTPQTIGMFRLFAELIAKNLDINRKLSLTESALAEERALAELREQFIAVLGHDLRTPMRGISCMVDLFVRRVALDRDAANMAQMMRSSASRMVGLIENLLDFARGRLGGGLPLNRDAAVPLEPVLGSVIEELKVANPDRTVETAFVLVDPVSCDSARIAQLFSNLLGNALTYGAPKEPVRVTAVARGGGLELSVANAGDPIPPVAMEQLFNPFYRNAASRFREGLGLGLFIAHEIAMAHGGTLTVDSSVEETRFTFRMPS